MSSQSTGQTPFWTEGFSNGCTAVCSTYTGTNGTWTVSSTGTNGASANSWFYSCAENGNAAGACGSTCGSDPSLHVGNVSSSTAAFIFCPTGDCGAAYDDSSPAEMTSTRAESPLINCSGYSNIALSFNYIENGQAASDDGSLWYYDGALWALLSNTPKTIGCGGFSNLWTTFSIQLPSSANNNPNVKIGFNWTNNGDGVATDPSYAIDDISLSVSAVNVQEFASDGIIFKAYPNPFNGRAIIELALAKDTDIVMEVFDAIGNKVITMVDKQEQAGIYEYVFNAPAAGKSSGLYFVKLRAGDQLITQKLILVK
jgi:hypothetical protein